jgi:hypothetical protein
MAISRAQLLKELLPGLNALFGMEYETVLLKKKPSCLALVPPPSRTKGQPLHTTTPKKRGLLDITTRQFLWASQ